MDGDLRHQTDSTWNDTNATDTIGKNAPTAAWINPTRDNQRWLLGSQKTWSHDPDEGVFVFERTFEMNLFFWEKYGWYFLSWLPRRDGDFEIAEGWMNEAEAEEIKNKLLEIFNDGKLFTFKVYNDTELEYTYSATPGLPTTSNFSEIMVKFFSDESNEIGAKGEHAGALRLGIFFSNIPSKVGFEMGPDGNEYKPLFATDGWGGWDDFETYLDSLRLMENHGSAQFFSESSTGVKK